jgi:LysM repeat protein
MENSTPNQKPAGNSSLPTITLAVLIALILALLYIGYDKLSDNTEGADEFTNVNLDTTNQQATATNSEPELIAPVEEVTDSANAPALVDLTEANPPADAALTDEATDKGEEGAEKVKAPVDKAAEKADETKKADPKKPETAKPDAMAVSVGGQTHTHTVGSGETFYGIAGRFNLKPSTLKALNPGVSEESVKSGVTKLKLKVRTVHTVGAGDVLRVVAQKYGISKEALMRANYKTKDLATRGEQLVIPFSERQ